MVLRTGRSSCVAIRGIEQALFWLWIFHFRSKFDPKESEGGYGENQKIATEEESV